MADEIRLIRQRGASTTEWAEANPVIPNRQLVFNTDTGAYRLGNGVDRYLDLLDVTGDAVAQLQDALGTVNDTLDELPGRISTEIQQQINGTPLEQIGVIKTNRLDQNMTAASRLQPAGWTA